jgi:hypothetical protein
VYDLNKAYSKKFFRQRSSLAWRAKYFCEAVIQVLNPKSVVDFGCGNGDLLRGFYDRTVSEILGVEGSTNCTEHMMIPHWRLRIHDLRKPFYAYYPLFDLAICLEVAEHLEPEYAPILLDSLCRCSDHVLFSAAGPGQGGIHHHNCQPKSYWTKLMHERGYSRDQDIENRIKLALPYKRKKGIKAYYQNLLYFYRTENIKNEQKRS